MNRELIQSTAFLRMLRKHLKKHPEDADSIEFTLELLAEDAFNPRLKTHKLKGDLNGVWACSAGYDLRILFEFIQVKGNDAEQDESILLLTMGTHDEVY